VIALPVPDSSEGPGTFRGEQLGDTTSGAFSDEMVTEMYNGWLYMLAVGDFRAANGLSYEGIGLAPDNVLVDTKAELDKGQDKLLEMAISKLK
jgi:carboxyl-terminal processing protease